MEENRPLGKEDYVEPRCVLCGDPYGAAPKVMPVPQQRIREKVDEYMSRRDYAGVERHLLYWLEEAKLGHDDKGELMIRIELIGHYRKTGEKKQGVCRGRRNFAAGGQHRLCRVDHGGHRVYQHRHRLQRVRG